jgi:hypothetical protein
VGSDRQAAAPAEVATRVRVTAASKMAGQSPAISF